MTAGGSSAGAAAALSQLPPPGSAGDVGRGGGEGGGDEAGSSGAGSSGSSSMPRSASLESSAKRKDIIGAILLYSVCSSLMLVVNKVGRSGAWEGCERQRARGRRLGLVELVGGVTQEQWRRRGSGGCCAGAELSYCADLAQWRGGWARRTAVCRSICPVMPGFLHQPPPPRASSPCSPPHHHPPPPPPHPPPRPAGHVVHSDAVACEHDPDGVHRLRGAQPRSRRSHQGGVPLDPSPMSVCSQLLPLPLSAQGGPPGVEQDQAVQYLHRSLFRRCAVRRNAPPPPPLPPPSSQPPLQAFSSTLRR